MGRPKKEPGEILVEVPCKVPSAVADLITEAALATDRSRSQIARKLLIRGLAAYERDGLLDEVEIVMANELTQADASARPVASSKPRKG